MTITAPIRSEEQREAALKRIEAHWGAATGTAERDEADVLIILMRVYDQKHGEHEPLSARDAVYWTVVDDLGVDDDLDTVVTNLAKILGGVEAAKQVLSGKALHYAHARILHRELQIPAATLLGLHRKAGEELISAVEATCTASAQNVALEGAVEHQDR